MLVCCKDHRFGVYRCAFIFVSIHASSNFRHRCQVIVSDDFFLNKVLIKQFN
jgi:hypothetical protein